MKPRRAFTLIELIIVVTIIALLIAIAVPTLAYARSVGKKTVCLTHARELSRSMSLYVSDWNALVPYSWPMTDTTVSLTANVWAIPLAPYGNSDKVRQCPETFGGSLRTPVGNSISPWTQYYLDNRAKISITQSGGFAINSWLSGNYSPAKSLTDEDSNTTDADDTGQTFGDFPEVNISYANNLRWARAIVNVPTFADGIWSETLPTPTDYPPPDLKAGTTDPNNQMARVCITRHRRTVNVAFFDGHAENMSLRNLWLLNWKPGWVPPMNLPKIP